MRTWQRYLRIARLDHWVKNVFMLPGVVFGAMLSPNLPAHLIWSIPLAFVALGLVASANYVINEWLDADADQYHPIKHTRPMVSTPLPGSHITLWYATLAASGLTLSTLLPGYFWAWSSALLIMGLLYNVPPLRTKDHAYLDVLSESINNPLRFMLGWTLVLPAALPPSSVLIIYWMGGAYLMAVKRYAEFRMIGDPQRACLYRRSFGTYTETSLLVSALFYAMMAALMLGVFLVKYRIEFIVSFPCFAILFAWYLSIANKKDSAAQAPEKLYQERAFMLYLAGFLLLLWGLWVIDIPLLHNWLAPLTYPTS